MCLINGVWRGVDITDVAISVEVHTKEDERASYHTYLPTIEFDATPWFENRGVRSPSLVPRQLGLVPSGYTSL